MHRLLLLALAVCAACSPGPQTSVKNTQEGYCSIGRQSSLFLIDQTTEYDDSDRAALLESIGAVVDGLGIGDRVVLATINAHYSQSTSLANKCKPGCPEVKDVLNSMLAECSPMRAQADLAEFKAGLVRGIGPVVTESKAICKLGYHGNARAMDSKSAGRFDIHKSLPVL